MAKLPKKDIIKNTKSKKSVKSKKTSSKIKAFPTLKLVNEIDIAMDFAQKIAEKFDKMVKSVVLFGSTTKKTRTETSDIDIMIILDDASIKFDQELIAWYREELGKLIAVNPYKKELHINTVKLTTWWNDLMKGDPVVLNIIRYGETLIDFGGFFKPLKMLLEQGKIISTPESIYTLLERAPTHLMASKQAEIGSLEGVYWAMIDSAHALLITAKVIPPSPEHITDLLNANFVNKGLLKSNYVSWFKEIHEIHKEIVYGRVSDIRGRDVDMWQDRAEEFMGVMAKTIDRILPQK